jgi:polyphosphate kinase 2 (PPK2 family)
MPCGVCSPTHSPHGDKAPSSGGSFAPAPSSSWSPFIHIAQLSEQQQLLSASNRYAVLLIFQAMDGSYCEEVLIARVHPDKSWKILPADIEERKFWKDDMKVYGQCLGATSTRESPWYVVPADDKANAQVIVSLIVLDTLASLHFAYPNAARKGGLSFKAMRSALDE